MCDEYDSEIATAYNAIIHGEPTSWLTLGLRENVNNAKLYKTGQDIHQLYKYLNEQNDALYGFVRLEDMRLFLFTFIPQTISNLEKIRILSHEPEIVRILDKYDRHIHATTTDDLHEIFNSDDDNLGRTASREQLRSSLHTAPYSTASTPMTDYAENALFTPNLHHIDEQYSESDEEAEEEEMGDLAPEVIDNPSAAEKKARGDERRAEQDRRAEIGRQEQQRIAERERVEKERAREDERLKQEEVIRQQHEEAERQTEQLQLEKAKERAFEKRLADALGKDVIFYGVASVQPSTSPFWRRRFIVVRGKSLLLYNEEKIHTPALIMDLKASHKVTVASIEQDDTFMPNSLILHTQEGSLKIYADCKEEAHAIKGAITKAANR